MAHYGKAVLLPDVFRVYIQPSHGVWSGLTRDEQDDQVRDLLPEYIQFLSPSLGAPLQQRLYDFEAADHRKPDHTFPGATYSTSAATADPGGISLLYLNFRDFFITSTVLVPPSRGADGAVLMRSQSCDNTN